jgi:hypothetical protein
MSTPAEATGSAPLFSLSPEMITKVSISHAPQCIVVQKTAETKELLQEISAMLLQGRVIRRFSSPVADVSTYGFKPATWGIVLVGADETRQHVLWLGHLNPVGNAVYARWHDGKEVLLVGSYFLTAVDVVFERLRSASLYAEITTDASCEEKKPVAQ